MTNNSNKSTIFIDTLREAYAFEDKLMRKKFKRSLSFQDTIFDRWERAKNLGFSEEVSIYNSALVFGNVSVGRGTWIGPYVVLEGEGGISIGSWCSIAAGVHIYTHNSINWALSGGIAQYEKAGVSIGDRCYIGPHSVISSGVIIGEGSIVATNSFVNKEVKPGTIVGGSPARRIGHVIFENESPKLVFDSKESSNSIG